jgi:hypothetical protein
VVNSSCLLDLFIFWILILMMFAKTTRPATTSASFSDSSVGRSGPQPASSTTAGRPAASPTAPPSLPTAAEARARTPVAEAAPQMEVTPPTAASGESAMAAASGAAAGAPSAEPVAEEVAAETRVEAATVGQPQQRSQAPPAPAPSPHGGMSRRWCMGGASSRARWRSLFLASWSRPSGRWRRRRRASGGSGRSWRRSVFSSPTGLCLM